MNNNIEQKKPISERIIAAAKSGQLKMRPKWHFVLRTVLWLAGTVVVTLALLYLLSLFLFLSRETGIWVAPMFGWRGILIFLASIPWLLVMVVVFFIAVLEVLVRRYSFAYRLPLLYSAIGVLLAVVAGGMILAGTPFHEMLSHCPPAEMPPVLGDKPAGMVGPPCGAGFYRDLDAHRFDNIHNGVVSEFSDAGFIITNRQREKLFIAVTRKTRLPFGEDFNIGDNVVIIGDRRGDQIEAFGISRVDE